MMFSLELAQEILSGMYQGQRWQTWQRFLLGQFVHHSGQKVELLSTTVTVTQLKYQIILLRRMSFDRVFELKAVLILSSL